MNGEMIKLQEALELVLTHRISFFLISGLATIFNFEFLKKIPLKIKNNVTKWVVLFGVLNGLFVALICGFLNRISPIWVMLVFPCLLITELAAISEDSRRSYFRIWLKCVFNFSCVYWGVTNILGMLTAEFLTKEVVCSVTILGVSIWTYQLSISTKFSMSSYRTIIHEKAAGKLFFRYFTICSLFLVFFTYNFQVFDLKEQMDMHALRMFCCEMFLKVVFIWWSSRLLFVMITNQLSYVKNETYTENILVKERNFRNTIMSKGICSFNIDVTRDEIKEGTEWLNSQKWGPNVTYLELINGMVGSFVHPEDEEEFLHTNNTEVIRERVDSAPYYSHQIRVSLQGMLENFSLGEQLINRYKNTEKEFVWLKIDYIYTRDSLTGDVYAYIAVFDVDLQVEQGEKLKKSASTDFLTGVLNRSAIEKRIEEKIMKDMYAGTFFIIDVDNFKSVNDLLGHPVGDKLLKQIASSLTELFGKNDLIGRLGGDEFCVFLSNVIEQEAVEAKAEELNEKCRIEVTGENGDIVKVSVSVGIASSQSDRADYVGLYRCADLALYETKRKGKDTYTIYSKGI